MRPQVLVRVYRALHEDAALSQREMAKISGLSLGTVNAALQYARQQGHVVGSKNGGNTLSEAGYAFLDDFKVDSAIVLAAGFGSRCVPLTYETPKGLLKVKGKPMLERQIEQLIEKGIDKIVLVVGYMKEAFDYLVDKYDVKLVYNPDFATKNNFASLYHAADYLANSYVLVADNWIEKNMFNLYEPESWFSCLFFEGETDEWCIKSSPSGLIESISIGGKDNLAVVGPAYFTSEFSETFKKYMADYYTDIKATDYYWEHILKNHLNNLPMYVNEQTGNVHEFEDLEELREYDDSYINNTENTIMEFIADVQHIDQGDIHSIWPLKEGVTNESFKFAINDEEFVFRLPGYGTDKLINRANEKKSYEALQSLGISDEVVVFDAESGKKISRYYANSRIADPLNDDDLKMSMAIVKRMHDHQLKVDHSYDIASMIGYYYSLANGIDAIRFKDIDETLKKVDTLIKCKERLGIQEVLCHGDFAHTNVLVLSNGDVRLIDWEYAGMADPIMDPAMYTIYAQLDKERIDLSLRYYLDREPTREEEIRFYMYIALGGFLWSMWSQYKQGLGQEFGEYPLIMYRYMKDYYQLLEDMGAFSE